MTKQDEDRMHEHTPKKVHPYVFPISAESVLGIGVYLVLVSALLLFRTWSAS